MEKDSIEAVQAILELSLCGSMHHSLILNHYFSFFRLQFTLTQPRGCNAVVAKLISSEDRMADWEDQHDTQNIDATVVAFKGRILQFPDTLQLQL